MGIYYYIKQVSPKILEEVLKSETLLDLIILAEPSMYEKSLKRGSHLPKEENTILRDYYEEKRKARKILSECEEYVKTNVEVLDLRKDGWEINFLLTECIDENKVCLQQVIYGEHSVENSKNYGYGKPSYLLPEEVKMISSVLNSITEEEIRSKFDPNKFIKADVYDFTEVTVEERLQDYLDIFAAIKDYYTDCVFRGNAVITYIG